MEHTGFSRVEFDQGYERLTGVGYPAERSADQAWPTFVALRASYAPVAEQLLFWTIAAPAPWSGQRDGVPDIADHPDTPETWGIAATSPEASTARGTE